jgi:anti-sigma factor RsiW
MPSVAPFLGGNIRVVEAVSPLIAPGCGTNAARNVINLFVWPSPDSNALPAAASRRGYRVQHGAASGMTYWAISDLNESDLSHFAHLVATDLSGTAVQP